MNCNNCSNCNQPNANKICSLCKNINYCSKECQSHNWKNHKSQCFDLVKFKIFLISWIKLDLFVMSMEIHWTIGYKI